MKILNKITFNQYILAWSLLIINLALLGGFINFTNIPYKDMWAGGIDSVYQILNGHYDLLWAQHMEHRLLLTRLFILIDVTLFNSSNIFLIISNYLIIFLSGLIFYKYLNLFNYNHHNNQPNLQTYIHSQKILFLIVLSTLFFWCQATNFIWSFDIQHYLVCATALSACFFCYKTSTTTAHTSWLYFILTILFSYASMASMANGIFILPLIFVYITYDCIVKQHNYTKIILTFGFTLLAFILYFYHFANPGQIGSPIHNILQNPLNFVGYFFAFIGSPFSFMVGKGHFGEFIATLAGLAYTFAIANFIYKNIYQNKQPNLAKLSLLLFIIFILVTAGANSAHRFQDGLHKAISSRYTTTALFAWASILTLYSEYLIYNITHRNKAIINTLTVITLTMIPYQLSALKPDTKKDQIRKLGILALALNIPDTQAIASITTDQTKALEQAKNYTKDNYAIFNNKYYKNINNILNSTIKINNNSTYINNLTYQVCPGHINILNNLDNKTAKITGLAIDTSPTSVFILDQNNKAIGYGLANNNNQYNFSGYLSVLDQDNFDNLNDLKLLCNYG